ncbi:expressed unknown protein [Seminavis robusta]|uniref:Uncharacterized protein n=1 Tax=Seminavis robusta TaxID=568900 RepID=A0A9N8ERK9_9STRA|nr:expressed unknown protein [Seminavis robusta]|eukprot:Sro1489_g276930.1 n/a (91) ;mRNA; r:7654-7926
MSKRPQSSNPPNTNDGCGNGFSLTAALAQGALAASFPPSLALSPTQINERSNMSRTRILAILEDALQIIDGEFDDGNDSLRFGEERLSAQ